MATVTVTVSKAVSFVIYQPGPGQSVVGWNKQTRGVAVLHVIAVWIVHAAFSTTLNATFLDDLCILRQ